jgi:acyl-CoA reductase-like NAD-dependent aldehyde dehydrogenase
LVLNTYSDFDHSNSGFKVAVKRLAVGKWGCNNGQACIAPDYIITTKSFAPKLVNAKSPPPQPPLDSSVKKLGEVLLKRPENKCSQLNLIGYLCR